MSRFDDLTPRDRKLARDCQARVDLAAVSETDLTIIAGTFARAIEVGAPGLSAEIKRAIVQSALVRLRHTLKPEGRS